MVAIQELDASESATVVFLKKLKLDMRKKIYLATPLGFDRSDPAGIDRDLTLFERVDGQETIGFFDYVAIDDDAGIFVILHNFICLRARQASPLRPKLKHKRLGP